MNRSKTTSESYSSYFDELHLSWKCVLLANTNMYEKQRIVIVCETKVQSTIVAFHRPVTETYNRFSYDSSSFEGIVIIMIIIITILFNNNDYSRQKNYSRRLDTGKKRSKKKKNQNRVPTYLCIIIVICTVVIILLPLIRCLFIWLGSSNAA